MKMKVQERAIGMIEGVGRMQPVTSVVTGEAQARELEGRPGMARAEAPAAELSLGRLAADMAAAPPVDAARVASLRAAIAEGNYRPDPVAIAGAMIDQAGSAR